MALKEIPEANAEQVQAAVAGNPATAQDARAATQKEYGTYVANQQIFVGNALGYNPGDAVGLDVVDRLKLVDEGKVVKVGTKAHNEIRKAQGLPPLDS